MTDLVPVPRTIVGTEQQLRAVLKTHLDAGTLVTPIDQLKATPTSRNPDKLWIRAEILVPGPRPGIGRTLAQLDRNHPIGGPVLKALLFGLVVLAGVLGLIFALIEVIKHTVSMQALTTFGGFLLVVALLFALAAAKGHGRHSGKGWHYTDCK